jgi:integrase
MFRDLQKKQLKKEAARITKETAVKLSEYLKYYNAAADRQALTKSTAQNAESAYHSLIKYAGDIPISDINKDIIDRYKLDAQGELKPSTINAYLTALNTSLSYAVETGILTEAPRFGKIKVGKRLRRVIMPDDLEKIRAAADPELLKAIDIALWTGARLSEVLFMRYEHKHGKSIRIIGKGDKERIVPLIGPAKEILTAQHIGPVFTKWTIPPSLSRAFMKVCRKTGVKARFHDLRHTAATNMLKKGVMLSAVQRILGHTSISITQIYADVLEDTLMEEMKKMEETK